MFWATTHGIAVVVPVRGFQTAKRPNVIVEVESTSHRPSGGPGDPGDRARGGGPGNGPRRGDARDGAHRPSLRRGDNHSSPALRGRRHRTGRPRPRPERAPSGPWAALASRGPADRESRQPLPATRSRQEIGQVPSTNQAIRSPSMTGCGSLSAPRSRTTRSVSASRTSSRPRTVSAGRPMGCRTTSPWLVSPISRYGSGSRWVVTGRRPSAYRVRVCPDAPRDTTSRDSVPPRDRVRACRWQCRGPAGAHLVAGHLTQPVRGVHPEHAPVAVVGDVDHACPRHIDGKDAVDRSDAQHRSGHRPRAQVDAEQRGDRPGEHADPGRAGSGRRGDARPVARVAR